MAVRTAGQGGPTINALDIRDNSQGMDWDIKAALEVDPE